MFHVTSTYDTAVWNLIKVTCKDLISSGEATKLQGLINCRKSFFMIELRFDKHISHVIFTVT
jgi:hypothetical protein